MTSPDVSDYRLAPMVVARIMGSYLVALALLMFVATAVVAVADWPADLLVVLLAVGVAGMVALAWWLRTHAYVVRFEAEGYRIGLVRGAGVREARWRDVTDAAATSVRGAPCLELRLRAGGSSVIPVSAMAVDGDDFVRDLRARLQHGHGLRP
ncbi:MAG: hypothetical protein M3237_00995, partial [Actinomycetota bacterium]|nr:hypothetical protein [Actinomycetota bacterium]